jgi:ankyrin repeat protein
MKSTAATLLASLLLMFAAATSAADPLNSHNLCSNTKETHVNLADTAITDATKAGDLKTLRAAFKAGVSPNATTYEGFSLLDIAITGNQDEVLELLIHEGADPNQPFNGSSPLALVGASNRAGMPSDQKREQMLVGAGARLSDFDVSFETVRKFGFRSVAEGFIDAITKGDMARLDLYARATYDIDAPLFNGTSPLHIAALQGTSDAVRFLAKCGANVNARTKRGAPVLWFAKDRPEIVALLRSLGATEKD